MKPMVVYSIGLRCEICRKEKHIKGRFIQGDKAARKEIDRLVAATGWKYGDSKTYYAFCPKCKTKAKSFISHELLPTIQLTIKT
jgi:hypothetical protein